jgi:ribosome maturation factor RimP
MKNAMPKDQPKKHDAKKAASKKAKAVTRHMPLTPEQVTHIEQAWHATLSAHLPDGILWLTAPFEQEDGAWYLRAFLETPDKNISLEQCEQVTRLLDEAIEKLPIPTACAYYLEISSPGLFRVLTTPKEFAFYTGETVTVATDIKAPAILGLLAGFDDLTTAVLVNMGSLESPTIQTFALTPQLVVTLNPPLNALEDMTP